MFTYGEEVRMGWENNRKEISLHIVLFVDLIFKEYTYFCNRRKQNKIQEPVLKKQSKQI
jgi:hypothetical protein